jgi:phage/plasmid-like protein (TIGR03299 family)
MGTAPQVAVTAGGTPIGPEATPAQAFAAAGADFLVEKRPLAYGIPLAAVPGTDTSSMPEDELFTFNGSRALRQHRAVVRPDTGVCLGVVGKGYTPVQNTALIQLFEFLREDARIENIVTLDGGRKIFATASIDIQGHITEGDTIRRYLHAFNSHDGSSAFGVFFSDMRLVCANQLRYIAGRGARRAASEGAGLVMRHTRSVEEFAKKLPQLIDLENGRFHRDLQELRPLTTAKLSTEAARTILEATYSDKLALAITDKDTGKKRDRTLDDLDTEMATIRSHAFGTTGIGIDPADRSIWNLFQAITQFETHDTGRAKDEISRARTRLESLWGGTASKRIERAREACLALV